MAACKPKKGMDRQESVKRFFFDAGDQNNHATEATRICASCPIREDCLHEAVTLRITDGIWGGAGTSRRRALRRAWREGKYGQAEHAHFKQLDGKPLTRVDRQALAAYGPDATHGSRETYARGCRECDACAAAASLYSVSKTIGVKL